jgi:hypothetical protein
MDPRGTVADRWDSRSDVVLHEWVTETRSDRPTFLFDQPLLAFVQVQE